MTVMRCLLPGSARRSHCGGAFLLVVLAYWLSLLGIASARLDSSKQKPLPSSQLEQEFETKVNPLPTEPEQGDFDDLNKLLEGAVVRLPNAKVENNIVTLYLRNIRCTNFSVDQITLQSSTVQQSAHDTFEITTLEMAIEGLDMVCYLDYTYEFIFVRSGSADLYSYGNLASVMMEFARDKLIDSPATTATVEECSPTINVNDLDFRGDIAAVVFDTVEKLMRSKVESEAETRLCEELRSLSRTLIADILKKADLLLAQYYNVDMNPLRAENGLRVPDSVKLMDLRDDSRAISKWLDKMLAYAVDFVTKIVPDRNGNDDMNINVFLRDNFLNNESLVLDTDLEVFENHNNFLDTHVVVDQVKIYGLDRIKKFEPFLDVGRYTIQNKLSWSILTIEMYVSIKIKPSSKEDSIFDSPSTAGTEEKVKITFGVQNIDVILSFLLAVDEKKLGALRLGALLYSDGILDCLLSTVYDVQVSGLSLEAADIQPPVMEGFVARGIDRVFSDLTDSAFLIYESAVLKAAPGFFNTAVKDFANDLLKKMVKVDVACFIPVRVDGSPDGYTDFRDLLLPPDQALAAGGMGTQPYGDLPHTLVTQIKEQFLLNDEHGQPRVNGVIREAIKKTSNRTDAVIELGDLLDWNTTVGFAGLEALVGIKILDASIGNLDSFGSPLDIFRPVFGEANMLNNSISVGVGSKPIRFTARLLITATDYDGLQLNNEVAVKLDLGGARLMAAIFLQIWEDPLFSVPIQDTLNLNCWLTTILPDAGQVNRALLQEHSFSLDQLLLNITCVSCTSPEFGDLIYGLYSPEEVGNATSKVLNILSLLRESDFLRVTTDTIVGGASKQCPHSLDFDPEFTYASLLVESGGEDLRHDIGERDEKVAYFNIANALLTALIVSIFVCVRTGARHRHRVWRDSLPDEALERLERREQTEAENETRLNLTTESMFRSKELPRKVRLLVPIAIVFTVGVQLVGHLALLSYLDIEGVIAGESFRIHKFLEFQFMQAALRSYRNGGKEMGLLLFVFTGIWPYLKLAACMVLWFVSPSTVSVSTRGSVLLWLDVFAKLSMVDILTTLLVVAAFLIYIGGVAERELSSGEFFATRIIIVPCAGCYCIVIAQRLTRISSTYLLNWHQQIIAAGPASSQDMKDVPSLDTLPTVGTCEVSSRSWVRDSNEDSSPESSPTMEAKKPTPMKSWVRQDGSWVWMRNVAETEVPAPDIPTMESKKRAPKSSWVLHNGLWLRCPSEHFEDEEIQCNDGKPEGSWEVKNQDTSRETKSEFGPEPSVSGQESHNSDSADTAEQAKRSGRRRRVAIGMTGMTVLILGIIGCILAPSVSIDAKTLWGILESGKTLNEVVSGYPLFRVVCSILVEARLVLDSTEAKAGLGILLFLALASTVAYPLLKRIQSLRKWKKQRSLNRANQEVIDHASTGESTPSPTSQLRREMRHLCWSGFQMIKRVPGNLRLCYDWCKGRSHEPLDASDMDLLPAYKMKAWRHMEVYVAAFVVSLWQLGAVSVYVIHQYCTILELCFETLVFLGLVEETSSQCFQKQASSPSFIWILISAFLVLMVQFFSEATGRYREVVAMAKKKLQKDSNDE